ncbi:MAG: hypothetical protein KAR36_13485, partial [Candidatus Latescibacteria bacterium]|nr:hypothetical protein [Candidatus Latescibacterota bacterium]
PALPLSGRPVRTVSKANGAFSTHTSLKKAWTSKSNPKAQMVSEPTRMRIWCSPPLREKPVFSVYSGNTSKK